jgi:hypothetical protein
MKFFIRNLCIATMTITSIHGVVVIKGNTVNDPLKTFTTPFNSCVFHAPTQTLFFGLDNNSGTYSLTKISTTVSSSIGIASTTGNNPLANTFVSNLALSASPTSDQLAIICTSTTNKDTLPTALFAVNASGSTVTTSGSLNDASGTSTAASIVGVAAGSSHVFAAVTTNGATTSFGTGANDGIALLTINPNTLALTPLNATNGSTNNQALTVTTTTTEITPGGQAVTFTTNYTPAMCWNEKLKRLYVGLQGTADIKMLSVLIAEVNDATNTLSLLAPVGNSYVPINGNTRIIGTQGANAITAQKLAVMETSTGFYYLIVQGGNGTAIDTNNLVYAVPLVSGNAADNILGTFAKADLTTNDFTIQATQAGDLFANTNVAAVVGGGGYPGGDLVIQHAPADNGDTQGISSLFVHGDTVFISIESTENEPVGATAPGIYYSQPLFNDKGKIQSWTAWAKAAPIASGSTDGSVHNVFVNALTGHIISTDVTKTILNKTEWYFADQDKNNALVNVLNETFTNGCFSSYVLDRNVKNFDQDNSFAFFGGYGTVAFAHLSSSAVTFTTDFSVDTLFLKTILPNDTAPVTSLGFSKWPQGENRGFFFAGTKNGLYAYVNTTTGVGFNQEGLSTFNFIPFPENSWQKITSVTGEVRSIESIGGSVYILTKSVETDGTIVDKVFQIPSQTNIADIINNTRTIAVSNTGNLENAHLFFDLALIPTSQDLSTSYALLATSNGLYKSANNIDGQNTQNNANWTQITTDVTDKIFRLSNTFYPLTCFTTSWTSSTIQPKSYNKILLHQFSSKFSDTELIENPTSYISNSGTPSVINTISALFNDGTRRFIITQPDNSNGKNNQLYTLPYLNDASHWNYTNTPRLLQDEFLSPDTAGRFYWIQMMGNTGKIYAGTDNGVTTLG